MRLRDVLAGLLLVVLSGTVAQAAKRALVIGNNAYEGGAIDTLDRAVADAHAYAKTLTEERGFKVTLVIDASRRQMLEALGKFVSSIEAGDVAMFVFSGHAMQLDPNRRDRLYLFPVDISNSDYQSGMGMEVFLDTYAISFGRIADYFNNSRARLRVFVLDACRDAPRVGERTRAGPSVGIGAVSSSEGEFIFYSAGPGEEALDSLVGEEPGGGTSVFTRVFLEKFKSGVYLEDIANDVQAQVKQLAAKSNHVQRPYYSDGVTGWTCLDEKCGREAASDVSRFEETYWQHCVRSDDPRYCRAYLEKFPKSPRALLAKVRMEELLDAQKAERVRREAEQEAARARAAELAEEAARAEAARKRAERLAREAAARAAREVARRAAEQAARERAEEIARKTAENAARERAKEAERKAAEQAAREARELARKAAEKAARERAGRVAEEAARDETAKAEREAAKRAAREAQELARKAAEEAARQSAEQAARKAAEEAELEGKATAERLTPPPYLPDRVAALDRDEAREPADENSRRRKLGLLLTEVKKQSDKVAKIDSEIAALNRRIGREKSAMKRNDFRAARAKLFAEMQDARRRIGRIETDIATLRADGRSGNATKVATETPPPLPGNRKRYLADLDHIGPDGQQRVVLGVPDAEAVSFISDLVRDREYAIAGLDVYADRRGEVFFNLLLARRDRVAAWLIALDLLPDEVAGYVAERAEKKLCLVSLEPFELNGRPRVAALFLSTGQACEQEYYAAASMDEHWRRNTDLAKRGYHAIAVHPGVHDGRTVVGAVYVRTAGETLLGLNIAPGRVEGQLAGRDDWDRLISGRFKKLAAISEVDFAVIHDGMPDTKVTGGRAISIILRKRSYVAGTPAWRIGTPAQIRRFLDQNRGAKIQSFSTRAVDGRDGVEVGILLQRPDR